MKFEFSNSRCSISRCFGRLFSSTFFGVTALHIRNVWCTIFFSFLSRVLFCRFIPQSLMLTLPCFVPLRNKWKVLRTSLTMHRSLNIKELSCRFQKPIQGLIFVGQRIFKKVRLVLKLERTKTGWCQRRQKGNWRANDPPITQGPNVSGLWKWTKRAMCKPDTKSYSPHLANYLQRFFTL